MFLASINGRVQAVTDQQAALVLDAALDKQEPTPGTYIVLRPDMMSVRLDFMGDSIIDALHRKVIFP